MAKRSELTSVDAVQDSLRKASYLPDRGLASNASPYSVYANAGRS